MLKVKRKLGLDSVRLSSTLEGSPCRPRGVSPRRAHTHLVSRPRPATSRTRVPQSSIPEIRLVFEAFNLLSISAKVFFAKIPAVLLNPDVPLLFNAFSDSFELFTRLASLSFQAVNRSNSRQAHSSSLFQAAKAMSLNWIEFIESMNQVSTIGMFPLFQQTEIDFQTILDLLERLNVSIKSHHFKTDAAANSVLELYRAVKRLKDDLLPTFESHCKQFDVHTPMKNVTNLTRLLFDRSILPYFRQAAEFSSIRFQILGKCQSISAAVESAQAFDEVLANLKMRSVVLNRELSTLHEQLNLPFSIEIAVIDRTETIAEP
jgi:hypothetical protein